MTDHVKRFGSFSDKWLKRNHRTFHYVTFIVEVTAVSIIVGVSFSCFTSTVIWSITADKTSYSTSCLINAQIACSQLRLPSFLKTLSILIQHRQIEINELNS